MERAAIIGPGAMGLLFGYYLAPVFKELVLIDQFKDRAKLINQQGIRIKKSRGIKSRKVFATTNPDKIGPVDLVILCVKAFDTEAAIQSAAPLIDKRTLVLTLQNGLGNAETIARFVPAEHVLGGTTAMAANLVGPGFVRFAGSGETMIGEFCNGLKNALQVAEKFNQAGLKARITGDLQGAVWSKAVINAGINPLTAILRVRNGMLLRVEESRKLLRGAVVESALIARAKGIKLIYEKPVKKAEEVARATSKNLSSMLQDVIAKQRTEIETINGAILREAHKLKIDAPVNRVLYALVKSLEKSYDERTA